MMWDMCRFSKLFLYGVGEGFRLFKSREMLAIGDAWLVGICSQGFSRGRVVDGMKMVVAMNMLELLPRLFLKKKIFFYLTSLGGPDYCICCI